MENTTNKEAPLAQFLNNTIMLDPNQVEVYTQVNYKKLSEFAKEPTRGSADAAGYDLYAATNEPITIAPHTTVKISTELSFELPKGTFGGVFARSGLATKQGLRLANCVGIIDSDYRGPVIIALHNDTNEEQTIEPQDRIAQLILLPYLQMKLVESNELTNTERGSGGFGSTGK